MDIIPFCFARGGSKGLPGKALRLLGGKPLIAHSIELGRKIVKSSCFIVSTDCPVIAQTSVQHGGAVPFMRPPELATDLASEWLAWQHAIREIRTINSIRDDFIFLSLPCTAPLRNSDDVVGALERFMRGDVDVVVTACEAHRSPYFNMVTIEQNGLAKIVCGVGGHIARRQDCPKVYDMTTVAYVARASFIENNSGVFSGKVGVHIVPPERALDIDTPLDFEIAEFLWQRQYGDASIPK